MRATACSAGSFLRWRASVGGVSTDDHHSDLGSINGLLDLLRTSAPVFEHGAPGPEVSVRLRAALNPPPWASVDVTEGERWTAEGDDGGELTWDVGFGAPTQAWLLRPEGERGALPGAVALHCHGGQKFVGKEKIADGSRPPSAQVVAARANLYGGRAYASDLARHGHAVLVHDVFGWGSRRAPVADMPARSESVARLLLEAAAREGRELGEDEIYDLHAAPHEDAMAKTLGVLGTSWGGVVAREDLIAVDVLNRRDDVRAGGVALIGMSGGGARAATASALASPGQVRATVIASMMSTMEHVLDGYLHSHTWMMMNPGLGRVADWPDVAAAARPRPLFVGYALGDALFPVSGMRAADARLRRLYDDACAPEAYQGVLVDAPHSLAGEMRDAAFAFLAAH